MIIGLKKQSEISNISLTKNKNSDAKILGKIFSKERLLFANC